MYKQVDTVKSTFLASNKCKITPIATLKSEYGGTAHIWIDDHCYQLGLECDDGVIQTTHIFSEAFEVLKTLPSLTPA